MLPLTEGRYSTHKGRLTDLLLILSAVYREHYDRVDIAMVFISPMLPWHTVINDRHSSS